MSAATNLMAGDDFMRYEMTHMVTESGIGWFACVPCEEPDFESGLIYLQKHPNDDFMHKYMLQLTGTFGPNLVNMLIDMAEKDDPCLLALMYETCFLNERLNKLTERFEGADLKALAEHSPLIYIRWALEKNQDNNLYWINVFAENTQGHKPLPSPDKAQFPLPFAQSAIDACHDRTAPIRDAMEQLTQKISQKGTTSRPTPKETAERAMEALKAIGVLAVGEAKTDGSLSPFAIQMPWRLSVDVSVGRNRWQLSGMQTSYGRGLHIDDTRASCLMEMVERYSAFACFDLNEALGYKKSCALIKARYEDLAKNGCCALNPNDMVLEVPYQNQELYWICAERENEDGPHSICVPAQSVFLFCNLDEVSLTSGLPSTGLASGNTLEGAKLRGLLEIIERDAERVMPYVEERCFLLETDDALIREFLQGCTNQGIHIQFLDITSEFGIPCYKAFIHGPRGEILKGAGANLDAKGAVLSALTEVPYPYPSGSGSTPPPTGIKPLKYEELPDYASGDPARDLYLLERLLIMNGYHPIYVDLTRKDLDIPVVKALIPGLEIMNDFDRFSRLSPRQFVHYPKLSR